MAEFDRRYFNPALVGIFSYLACLILITLMYIKGCCEKFKWIIIAQISRNIAFHRVRLGMIQTEEVRTCVLYYLNKVNNSLFSFFTLHTIFIFHSLNKAFNIVCATLFDVATIYYYRNKLIRSCFLSKSTTYNIGFAHSKTAELM